MSRRREVSDNIDQPGEEEKDVQGQLDERAERKQRFSRSRKRAQQPDIEAKAPSSPSRASIDPENVSDDGNATMAHEASEKTTKRISRGRSRGDSSVNNGEGAEEERAVPPDPPTKGSHHAFGKSCT